jgi:hypothetical protein
MVASIAASITATSESRAVRLGYVSETDLALAAEQIDHVGRMLTNLGASLRSV